MINEFKKKLEETLNSSMILSALGMWLSIHLQLFTYLIMSFVIFFNLFLAYQNKQINKNNLALSILYFIRTSSLLSGLFTSLTSTEMESIGLERIV